MYTKKPGLGVEILKKRRREVWNSVCNENIGELAYIRRETMMHAEGKKTRKSKTTNELTLNIKNNNNNNKNNSITSNSNSSNYIKCWTVNKKYT